tara:strand:- start:1522 stop:1722 length:201 start_codon:yes stop_codon:yes gene_type:complete
LNNKKRRNNKGLTRKRKRKDLENSNLKAEDKKKKKRMKDTFLSKNVKRWRSLDKCKFKKQSKKKLF